MVHFQKRVRNLATCLVSDATIWKSSDWSSPQPQVVSSGCKLPSIVICRPFWKVTCVWTVVKRVWERSALRSGFSWWHVIRRILEKRYEFERGAVRSTGGRRTMDAGTANATTSMLFPASPSDHPWFRVRPLTARREDSGINGKKITLAESRFEHDIYVSMRRLNAHV